jgi:DNA transformation protein
MTEQTFKDHLLDRLAGLGEFTSRAMFGGPGICWRGVIFGIVFQDRLYLKVDDCSRRDFLAQGMGPFRPNQRQTLRSCYEVPPEVAADGKELVSWVKQAIRVGTATKGG